MKPTEITDREVAMKEIGIIKGLLATILFGHIRTAGLLKQAKDAHNFTAVMSEIGMSEKHAQKLLDLVDYAECLIRSGNSFHTTFDILIKEGWLDKIESIDDEVKH